MPVNWPIVERAEYDAESEQMLTRLMSYRCDEFIKIPLDGVRRRPEPIEVVVFGLPCAHINSYKFHAPSSGVDSG